MRNPDYLPLYVFCGRHLPAAKLRRSDIDASAGAVAEVERIIGQIRASWPQVEILLRAASGFARDELMVGCEDNGVDYVFGLARNPRLLTEIDDARPRPKPSTPRPASPPAGATTSPMRPWTAGAASARVVAKAEHLAKGANRRFVVTSVPATASDARTLYEGIYCARGEMENRIQEQRLDLSADRRSAATMRANQLRLWFAPLAYGLREALRRIGLHHTQCASATCGTCLAARGDHRSSPRSGKRLKLLKIGAQVRVSLRRITIAMRAARVKPRRWPRAG